MGCKGKAGCESEIIICPHELKPKHAMKSHAMHNAFRNENSNAFSIEKNACKQESNIQTFRPMIDMVIMEL